MKFRRKNLWSWDLMAPTIALLLCATMWAGEPPVSPEQTAEKADRPGLFSRFVKGLARPLAGQPGPNGAKPDRNAPAADPAPGASGTQQEAAQQEYVIGLYDVLAVSVWREPQVSREVPVRPDGKISMPLAGEIQAAGRTPLELQAQITEALKPYIASPEVTVIVQKVNPPRFNILGEVQRPGSYEMAKGMSVLDAIAMGGGFREFAKVKDIYVLRRGADGAPLRLPFNYKEVKKGRNFEQNIGLEPGDTIVVP